MHKFIGKYYRLLYNLDHHYFIEVKLRTWLNWALVLLVMLALLIRAPGSPAAAIFFLLFILFLSVSSRWARRRYYIHFVPKQNAESPVAATPFRPEDKLLHYASGHFIVEDKEGNWTHLVAYYRTFATREHAIMARLTPSYFLKLGEVNPEALGMWYIFITPENLLAVTPGEIYFGGEAEPGLRLRYRRFTEKGKPLEDIVYLHFGSETDKELVLADLAI